jgi:hypothetical protein
MFTSGSFGSFVGTKSVDLGILRYFFKFDKMKIDGSIFLTVTEKYVALCLHGLI